MAEIPIQQVVSRAAIQLKEPNKVTDYEMYAEEAVRQLKCLSSYEKQHEIIDVIDYKAQLPCGFFGLLSAQPYDENGTCCCEPDTVYVDTIFTSQCGCTLPTNYNYRHCATLFEIIGNYICFHTPTNVTKLSVWFIGLPKNDHGLTVINDRYEFAIANYIMYQDGISPGSKLQRWQTEKYFENWTTEKKKLRGEDILNKWNLQKWYLALQLKYKIPITPKM